MKELSRNIPVNVKKILREEVNFVCPVPDCLNPYLEWHHFDPPWSKMKHHNPEGMIALCCEHHIQADNGAFTDNQLFSFKKNAKKLNKLTSGKFNWMRNKLLIVVGGNFYWETPIIFKYRCFPIIWFERDLNNNLLLNLRMLTSSKKSRAYIVNNEWYNTGKEEDIICPPSSKKLQIKYNNGDFVSIEFIELLNLEMIKKNIPIQIVKIGISNFQLLLLKLIKELEILILVLLLKIQL